MSEPSKNERVRECTTSEYPKDESTNEETRTTQSTAGDSSESPKIEREGKHGRMRRRQVHPRAKKASAHARPSEHERARRTHQDEHAHESVASDGLDERSEDRTERAYPRTRVTRRNAHTHEQHRTHTSTRESAPLRGHRRLSEWRDPLA